MAGLREHLPRYLREWSYRFNRRNLPDGLDRYLIRMRHHHLRPAQGRRHTDRRFPRPPPPRYGWATCFLVRHRRSRPAGHETCSHGVLRVVLRRAGAEVGFCLVRLSPFFSWTRDS